MLPKRPIGYAAIAAAALMVVATGATAQDMMFGGEEDTAFAADLWQAMSEAGLAGEGAIHARPYVGTEPHGAALETLNATISVNGEQGMLVVKRNYGPAGVEPSVVWEDPAAHLAAITVMFQREGYDPDNQDWYWVKYLPDGSLDIAPNDAGMAGKVEGCISCHMSAGGDDYLFVND